MFYVNGNSYDRGTRKYICISEWTSFAATSHQCGVGNIPGSQAPSPHITLYYSWSTTNHCFIISVLSRIFGLGEKL